MVGNMDLNSINIIRNLEDFCFLLQKPSNNISQKIHFKFI